MRASWRWICPLRAPRPDARFAHYFLSQLTGLAINELVCGFLPQVPLRLAVDAQDQPFALMFIGEGHLESFFVEPGQGLDAVLVRHALTLHPGLTTDVNEQNSQARDFTSTWVSGG